MNGDRRKKPSVGSIISVIIALILFSPELLAVVITIGLFALPFYIAFRIAKKQKSSGGKSAEPFDDCPKPVCFHKDKGEHHVVRGKEIDPWDRPDIDISKYQRR